MAPLVPYVYDDVTHVYDDVTQEGDRALTRNSPMAASLRPSSPSTPPPPPSGPCLQNVLSCCRVCSLTIECVVLL